MKFTGIYLYLLVVCLTVSKTILFVALSILYLFFIVALSMPYPAFKADSLSFWLDPKGQNEIKAFLSYFFLIKSRQKSRLYIYLSSSKNFQDFRKSIFSAICLFHCAASSKMDDFLCALKTGRCKARYKSPLFTRPGCFIRI
jgi:hypothetical protein